MIVSPNTSPLFHTYCPLLTQKPEKKAGKGEKGVSQNTMEETFHILLITTD